MICVVDWRSGLIMPNDILWCHETSQNVPGHLRFYSTVQLCSYHLYHKLTIVNEVFFPVFPCLTISTISTAGTSISTISTARDIHSCNLNCRNISTISTAGISTNSTRGLYPFVYSHHGTSRCSPVTRRAMLPRLRQHVGVPLPANRDALQHPIQRVGVPCLPAGLHYYI